MKEEQRERELVYEEMVRKYLIIVYLYLGTLFILFIIVTRNRTILYKNKIFNIVTIFSTILYEIIFSIRNSKHKLQFAAGGSKALNLETFCDKFVLNFKTIFLTKYLYDIFLLER